MRVSLRVSKPTLQQASGDISIMGLTATQVKNAKPGTAPLKLADGYGLYLEIRPTGAKLWRYRYRIAGKESLFTLGTYPKMSLADARTQRDDARALVKQGIHPLQERKATLAAQAAENANTFEALAREWIAQKQSRWTPGHRKQVEQVLSADVFPVIGDRPIRNVTAADLLAILKALEKRGATSIAYLVRQWASAIFRYAVATLRADSDPAAALRGAIHRPKTVHHRPLTRGQITDFLKALENYGGYRPTVIALRLMLLTAVRTVELRGAKWEEFDLEAAQWRIPGERMKMQEPHIVPLSRQAVILLRELATFTGGRDFLFPNMRTAGTCMTATTLNRALERLGFAGAAGIGFSAHGFRGTFSTQLNELNYRADLIETQLAHRDPNAVRGAYNFAAYLPERIAMMQQWADLCDELATDNRKVIPIRRQAA